MRITIEATVHAPPNRVWAAWNDPRAIEQWNAATPDWHTPLASVGLREGGRFCSRMEAKAGSAGFDFEGTYTKIEAEQLIEYAMSDGRKVHVEFIPAANSVTVRETFDVEDMHSAEQQRQGWQAILDNFTRYVEGAACPKPPMDWITPTKAASSNRSISSSRCTRPLGVNEALHRESFVELWRLDGLA